LVRSHRLWESYLVKHLGLPLDHVHDPAHRVEHYIDESIQKQIAAELEPSAQDPHGREIPK
jgi:Mn-dependent DtxR family transcriptional regulator